MVTAGLVTDRKKSQKTVTRWGLGLLFSTKMSPT
jgi:hypothetical protein